MMIDSEWVARIEKLFDISKGEQETIIQDLASGESDAVHLLILLSWGTLRQHGIHPSRVRQLISGAIVKIRQDVAEEGHRHNRRHPAWIVIDNRFIRYGYFEVEGSPLDEWTTIDPDCPDPKVEEIAMPVILTIYNIRILKTRMES